MQPLALLTQPQDRPYNERLEVRTSTASHLQELSGWDPISEQWEECQALQDWLRNIERARAKLAGRSVPPSTTDNRPTRQPSGNPQRPHAVGKPLHLGVIRGGPELYP
jgi:hypothetical protein